MDRSVEVSSIRRIIALALLLVMVLLFANTALASAQVFSASAQVELDGRQISPPASDPSNQAARAMFVAIAATAAVGWISYGGYRLYNARTDTVRVSQPRPRLTRRTA